MISHIRGKLKKKSNSSIVLDTGSVCYEILMPQIIMKSLEGARFENGTVELVTYHYLAGDPSRTIPMLVGFLNEVEKEFFEQFITVSGIGPKAAVKALSLPISSIAAAIDRGDLATLQSLPGIGAQRAREIIAKLQGKVGKYGLIQDSGREAPCAEQDIKEEALEVLLQLQYKRNEALDMIKKACERNRGIKTVEELLNEVYKQKSVKG